MLVAPTRIYVLNHRSDAEDAFAARLAAGLVAAGAEVARDDGGADQPGSPADPVERLTAGPEGDRWLLVALTPQSAASERIQLDVAAALRERRHGRVRGVALVEMTSVPAAEIPLLWRALPRFDAIGGVELIHDALLATLAIAPPPAAAPPLAPSPPPVPATSPPAVAPAPAALAPSGGPPQQWLQGLAAPSPWYTRPAALALTGLLVVAVAAGAVAGWRVSQSLGASARLPTTHATQTAEAALVSAALPTSAYGPTPPGSCDRGPLASAWTAALENGNVRCEGDTARVIGPAILYFQGNAGIAIGVTFFIHVDGFSAEAVTDCLDFRAAFPHTNGPRSLVHMRLCPDGTATAGYLVGFSDTFPVTTTQASLADGALDVTMSVLASAWSVSGGGVTLDSESYPGTGMEPTGTLTSFTVQVDSGAQVALSSFTIASAA